MFQSELLSSSEGKTTAVSTPWEHSVASCPADQLTPEGGEILQGRPAKVKPTYIFA